jgi:hypothetical protein
MSLTRIFIMYQNKIRLENVLWVGLI